MACNLDSQQCCCPFAWTEASEQAQNYGCLPSQYDIVQMRVEHGKTWACHDEPTIPCIGAIKYLKEKGLPYTVIDPELLTEQTGWPDYCGEA